MQFSENKISNSVIVSVYLLSRAKMCTYTVQYITNNSIILIPINIITNILQLNKANTLYLIFLHIVYLFTIWAQHYIKFWITILTAYYYYHCAWVKVKQCYIFLTHLLSFVKKRRLSNSLLFIQWCLFRENLGTFWYCCVTYHVKIIQSKFN